MKDCLHEELAVWREIGAQVIDGWRELAQEWAALLADAWRLVRRALA